ncbi:MAG: class I SAM-dependent methyltransferase [Nocardioides sp.]
MPDPLYADPRLARLYDAFDGARDDLTAYLGLVAELRADRVLDVGCGTGTLALLLAGRGRTVTGVDPAEASLAVARAKPGAEAVTWLQGDATTLPAMQADLAVMTGNVAQVFVADHDWAATLRGLHAAVRPGGHLVLETRIPERRAWEDWGGRAQTCVVPGVGKVGLRTEVTAVTPPMVSFRHRYDFPDGQVLHSDSTLRFRGRDEMETSLAAHGFVTREVREAPDRPGLEHVFLARRTP